MSQQQDVHMQDQSPTPHRMALLTESFHKCLTYGLTQPSLTDMQAYFPGYPQPVVHALLDLYKQVLAHIEVHSQAEFKDICQEHGIQDRLAEVERLSAQAQQSSQQAPGCTTELTAAVHASEMHARVTAKQQEVAHLQHLLDQATSTRDHLLEVAAQKQVEAQRQVEAYSSVGDGVKQVFEASTKWQETV